MHVPTQVPGRQSPVVVLTDSLEKPSLDDRHYRLVRLENGLEALLAHDPETDMASAALDVNVGSFSDEDGMPGMAHAVEHVSRAFFSALFCRLYPFDSLLNYLGSSSYPIAVGVFLPIALPNLVL
jgi:hypothetical protein